MFSHIRTQLIKVTCLVEAGRFLDVVKIDVVTSQKQKKKKRFASPIQVQMNLITQKLPPFPMTQCRRV